MNRELKVTRGARQGVATKTYLARAVLATSVLPLCIIPNSKSFSTDLLKSLWKRAALQKVNFDF
jgi:hypothetical protein